MGIPLLGFYPGMAPVTLHGNECGFCLPRGLGSAWYRGVASQTNWVPGRENVIFQEVRHGTQAASLRNLPPARTRGKKTAITDRQNLALAHRMVSRMEVVSTLAGRGGEAVGSVMRERLGRRWDAVIGVMPMLGQLPLGSENTATISKFPAR